MRVPGSAHRRQNGEEASRGQVGACLGLARHGAEGGARPAVALTPQGCLVLVAILCQM